jgi:hypothetical protein
MAPKLDYRWNLRRVMAERAMFQTPPISSPRWRSGASNCPRARSTGLLSSARND